MDGNFQLVHIKNGLRTVFRFFVFTVFRKRRSRKEGENERMEKHMALEKDIREGKERTKRRAISSKKIDISLRFFCTR
jgi:hypothetical protein